MHSSSHDTICALATPSGIGALGIIRVSGSGCFEIVNSIFSKNILEEKGNSIVFGRIMDDTVVLDEVLLSIFRNPRSFTGEDSIEISCHGSSYILQRVLGLLLKKGCRLADGGEFSLRAYLNGKMDLSQTEAIADLIASESESEHKMAMHQMRGGFSQELKTLRQQLIDFAAMIELELDFGEEDVEFANREQLERLIENIQVVLRRLIDSFSLGNVIKQGIPVAIVGKPNAGKSTLLNALLNEERALVTEIAGTTRDSIEDEIIIKGTKFRFIDTAGIRETSDKVEALGVQRALDKIESSSLVILLFDVQNTTEIELSEIKDLVSSQKKDAHLIVCGNKIDGLSQAHIESKFSNTDGVIWISAKDGSIAPLLAEFESQIDLEKLHQGNTIVSNSRHLDALTKASESLAQALHGLQTGISGDFVAMDIRQSLHQLGLITGEISTEDLLGSIFSRFCIGK